MGLSEEDLARIRKIRRLEPAPIGVTARPQPTTEGITGQISFSSREAQILEAQRRTAEQEQRAAEFQTPLARGVDRPIQVADPSEQEYGQAPGWLTPITDKVADWVGSGAEQVVDWAEPVTKRAEYLAGPVQDILESAPFNQQVGRMGLDALRMLGLGSQYIGLPVGTMLSIQNPVGAYMTERAVGGPGQVPFQIPTPGRIPGAARAFVGGLTEETEGDTLTRIQNATEAYHDAMKAGWGYWFASEMAAGAAAPIGLAAGGRGVVGFAARPGLMETVRPVTRLVPGAGTPTGERIIRTGLGGLGETMQVPLMTEEAIGRAIAAPFRGAVKRLRTRPAFAAPDVGRSITDTFGDKLNAGSVFEGGEVMPNLGYSWRSMGPAEYNKIMAGKPFGGPAQRGGFWSWFPRYSANLTGTPKRPKYLVEVEIPSKGEALTRAGTLDDVRAVWKSEGKDSWIPEEFAATTTAAPTGRPPTPLGKNMAALHQRLLNSPVRSRGIDASSDAALKRYFADLARFVKGVAPDDKALRRTVERAEEALLNGDFRAATVQSERALSQGHIIGGASFPDEDYFLRGTFRLAEEVEEIPERLATTTAAPGPGTGARAVGEAAEGVEYGRFLGYTDEQMGELRATVGGGPPRRPGGRVPGEGPPPTPPPTPGGRKGNLLQAITAKALGLNYKVKAALRVGQDLDDQITSTLNIIQSRVKDAIRLTGKIGKIESGPSETRMLDVPGTPSINDVAENPLAYPQVTPRQMEGVRKLTRIISDIKEERKLFGIGPEEITVGDEGDFLHRMVLKRPGDEEELLRGGFGGGRLRRPSVERSRKVGVGESAEAEAGGTVYAHPAKAINEYAERHLRGAANTHMKELLVPFSETAATRVPEALRQRVQALVRQAQSLRQSGIRLAEEQDAAIKAFIQSDDPSIDAFRDVISGIQIKRGQFRGQDFAGTQRLLREIRQETNRLAPEWREAKLNAIRPRKGRAVVSEEYTPWLAGRDFTYADANAIRKHYWSRSPKYAQNKYMNAVLNTSRSVRFLNATLDLSAFLRQQASALAIHPKTTLNNFFVKSFRDVVDSNAYDALLASPKGQRAASRGVAIFGNAGELAEFQAQSWMDRIPIIKQANNHFIRFNTRQRIDLFDLETRIYAKKFKRALTPDEEDAIARAINRATGVSKSRGRGWFWKTADDSLFAARYTRATIEETLKLASFGTIEGNMARRYIGHLVAVTTALVTATAIMQKRDLMEVLNPIDTRRRAEGEIALNPNFLSIRVFGHDVKPMGAYDSMARIMFMATDLTYGLITQRQYDKLTDFVQYAAGTKGNPLVSFGVDIFRGGLPGKTFTGDDTLSPAALAKRVAPFTVQNIATSIQRGMPWEQAIPGGIIEGLGVKTSPMSYSDFSNEFARKQYGERFVDLEGYQRDKIRDRIQAAIEKGEIAQRQAPDEYWGEVEDIYATMDTKMAGLVGAITRETITDREAVDVYFNIKDEARVSRERAAERYKYDPDHVDPNEKDPNKLALNRYYNLIDAAQQEGFFNPGLYSKLRESYEGGLAANYPEQLQYIYRNTNRRPIPQEILKVLEEEAPTTYARILKSQDARKVHGEMQLVAS